VDRVGFAAALPGYYGGHMALEGLFQKPVYPRPFQEALVFASIRHGSREKIFRHFGFLNS
jgi:hypothetical protein